MGGQQNIMEDLAKQIFDFKENIVLIYAFNGVGKTRLSVAYKDITKAANNGDHSGVYYNAYSEDLFVWDNDEENSGDNIRLLIQRSSLNQLHSSLDEDLLREKLKLYKPKFDFKFDFHSDVAEGIESIQFFLKNENQDEVFSTEASAVRSDIPIKISRGEEQVFIWCIFLTLFDIESWTGKGNQSSHFFY